MARPTETRKCRRPRKGTLKLRRRNREALHASRILGVHSTVDEPLQTKYERVAQHVLQHSANASLGLMGQIGGGSTRQLRAAGEQIVGLISGASKATAQTGGGGVAGSHSRCKQPSSLQATREKAFSNLDALCK
jgi:hypothetical protein